jgi:preprotein translocase subunit SecB
VRKRKDIKREIGEKAEIAISGNAPAIAFPYLRSFISTLTLNAGYILAVLLSINFVNFNTKK